jgi:hypothetical protein
VVDADRRYFLETKTFGGLNPAMAREDSLHSVNHDGPQESKTLNTFRELINLPIVMKSWIPGIALQICNRNPNDGGRKEWLCAHQRTGGFGGLL